MMLFFLGREENGSQLNLEPFSGEKMATIFFSFFSRWNCWLLPNHHQPLNRYPLGLREHLCGVAYARRANPRPEKKIYFNLKTFGIKYSN